ncbi:MAG: efflux RND transporter periplasmic adaptor subunit [Pirellulales bacterium]|nr:efflux RND transporter periplasmic adaptor subunit [Pirellulales bacterium]
MAAVAATCLALGGLAAVAMSRWWLPCLPEAVAPACPTPHHSEAEACGEDAHRGDTGDEWSLELDEQGRKNAGVTLALVGLKDFERTISVPGTLVERSGQAQVVVSAPMTGIVTRIYPIQGEAVLPGGPLFDLRLTHEDLVEKQSTLLRAMEELDVVEREVARLEQVTASGAVAGKQLLERQYEQRKIEAAIRAERQALLLHGMSEEQVQRIVEDRQLQQSLVVSVPPISDHAAKAGHEEILQVAELSARLGEHVVSGTRLATLTDHCELYIEGKAFEQDAGVLGRAANAGTEIAALLEGEGAGNAAGEIRVGGLRVLYVENQVEQESRALKFYVVLTNELVRNETTPDGHRFIGWRYRPGQRVKVLIPVERWKEQIVLPVEAVVEEGVERFVYQEVGDRFVRRPVHVEYRDQSHAVIERDGTLSPGDRVAAGGAYAIHLALKGKAGGGPDPHAGHQH